jgi:hypothetical protein
MSAGRFFMTTPNGCTVYDHPDLKKLGQYRHLATNKCLEGFSPCRLRARDICAPLLANSPNSRPSTRLSSANMRDKHAFEFSRREPDSSSIWPATLGAAVAKTTRADINRAAIRRARPATRQQRIMELPALSDRAAHNLSWRFAPSGKRGVKLGCARSPMVFAGEHRVPSVDEMAQVSRSLPRR